MTQVTQALTYTTALDSFFGGIHGLARQSLPFKCKCGDTTFPEKFQGGVQYIPIMKPEECFKHIRRVHKERIKK